MVGILEEYRATVSEQQLDLGALKCVTPGNGLLASPGCAVMGDSPKGQSNTWYCLLCIAYMLASIVVFICV